MNCLVCGDPARKLILEEDEKVYWDCRRCLFISLDSKFRFSSDLSIDDSWTLSLLIKAFCAKSRVSVSANRLKFKSYSWTRSKFWNKNIVDNKKSIALSLVNSIFSLFIWSEVLFIIFSCWLDLLLIVQYCLMIQNLCRVSSVSWNNWRQ